MIKFIRKIIPVLLILIVVSCNSATEPFSFVQICDPQLGMGGYEHDMETLDQAVRQINDMDVDFAIFCGDLVNHASEESFADFNKLISGLNVPSYYVPGNHDVGMVPDDSTLAFYREVMGEDYFSMKHKGAAFIFTNSQLWKSDIGEESTKHDAWFKHTLESIDSKGPAIVIGHFPIYVKSLDEEESYSNFPLEKRQEILATFKEMHVSAYLSGHRHEFIKHNYNGIQLVTGESTSKNFDKRPFGFRKWDVSADTLIHSFVELEVNHHTEPDTQNIHK